MRLIDGADELDPNAATIMQRARAMVENAARHSRDLHRLDAATMPDRRLTGVPAFVVGAGPSLDGNGHWLREASAYGVVITSNTALPAVNAHGVVPDATVVLESVDVSAHRGETRRLVADIGAHDAIWQWAMEHPAGSWMYTASPHLLAIHRHTRVLPVAHSGAATTAAYSLARMWGCDPVILVGCDLAMGHKRQGYATASGWDGWTVDVDGERLVMTGREDRDAAHDASGLARIHRNPKALCVPGWGGYGEVTTKVDYEQQRQWLGERTQGARLNATEGGAHVDGWHDVPLEVALDALRMVTARDKRLTFGRVGEAEARRTRNEWAWDAQAAKSLSRRMAHGDTPLWGPLVDGTEMTEALAMGDAVMRSTRRYLDAIAADSNTTGEAVDKVLRHTYGALAVAADALDEAGGW